MKNNYNSFSTNLYLTKGMIVRMNYSKIGSIEAIALIVVILLNHIILNLPKSFIDSCGSSSSLNVIFITILVFIFLYIVLKLFKHFSNCDIIDISEFLGGKFLKIVIGILFISYFIVICATQLRSFGEILKIVYFPKVAICFLISCFLVVAVIANKFGSKTIIKANLIIVPLIMFNLIIAFFGTVTRFVPERIFPILGYGLNETFFSGISNIFAFNGIAFIYFLPTMIDNENRFKRVSFISIGISSLFLFLSVTCLMFSYADVLSINEISPIYLLIRGSDFGKFLQRPDAIFFLGWILGLMSYVSISILFITKIMKKIGNLHDRFSLSYATAALIFIIALIPKGIVEIRFMQDIIYKYYTLGLVFIISFIILALANAKKKFKNSSIQKNTMESDLENE